MPVVRVVLALAPRPLRAQVRRRIEEVTTGAFIEVANGPDALAAVLERVPDLVVAQADLPGPFDGLALCHRLRGQAGLGELPVMILGPRGDQRRKYQAFYVGATDYMEVPLDGLEFVLRVRVQLRASLRSQGEEERCQAGALALDLVTRTARLGEAEAVLTPSELAVLRALARQPGRPLSAEQLLKEALRRPEGTGNPQLIHTHIRNLRKKLEPDPGQPRWLQRHPAGYLLAQEP